MSTTKNYPPHEKTAAIFEGKRYEPESYGMQCGGHPSHCDGGKHYGMMYYGRLEVLCATAFAGIFGDQPLPEQEVTLVPASNPTTFVSSTGVLK
jgi:hypothetical protein